MSVFQDLAELKQTCDAARSTLLQLQKNLAVLPGPSILETLNQTMQEIRHVLLSLEKAVPSEFWHSTKVKVYQLDFLLKMQSDQISLALSTSDYSSLLSHSDGKKWWTTAFGDKTAFVPWATFFTQLAQATQEDISHDERAIKTFLDFCKDDLVSPFELDVFLRWFGPLPGCCGRMLDALRSGLLAGFVPAIEANVLLENKPIGSFLIRFSKTKPGSFAVTFVDHTKQIKHVLLYNADPAGVTLKTPPTVYPTLNAFTAGHSGKLKWPVGTKAINELAAEASSSRTVRETGSSQQPQVSQATNLHTQVESMSLGTNTASDDAKARYEEPDLSTNIARAPIRPASPARLHQDSSHSTHVSSQQSSQPQAQPASAQSLASPKTETCVICLDAPRETVFLECGHMVACRQCATLVQDCPICRQKIARVIPVFKA